MLLRCTQIIPRGDGFFTYYFVGKNDDPVGIQIISSREDAYERGKEYLVSVLINDNEMTREEEREYARLGS